jgi:hypothetical protein
MANTINGTAASERSEQVEYEIDNAKLDHHIAAMIECPGCWHRPAIRAIFHVRRGRPNARINVAYGLATPTMRADDIVANLRLEAFVKA